MILESLTGKVDRNKKVILDYIDFIKQSKNNFMNKFDEEFNRESSLEDSLTDLVLSSDEDDCDDRNSLSIIKTNSLLSKKVNSLPKISAKCSGLDKKLFPQNFEAIQAQEQLSNLKKRWQLCQIE